MVSKGLVEQQPIPLDDFEEGCKPSFFVTQFRFPEPQKPFEDQGFEQGFEQSLEPKPCLPLQDFEAFHQQAIEQADAGHIHQLQAELVAREADQAPAPTHGQLNQAHR